MQTLLVLVVLLVVIVVAIMSIILHEVAHGWVAAKCGDHTAAEAGRLTLNPIRHIDPFLTILMPIALLYLTSGRMVFGAAKPVPINPYRFRNLKADYFKVSIAGLTVNLGLALLFVSLIKINLFPVDSVRGALVMSYGAPILWYGLLINIALFSFNILPIPPLDGSRALRVLLPNRLARLFDMMDTFGFIIIILLFPVLVTILWIVISGMLAVFGIDFKTFFEVNNKFREMLSAIW